MTTTTDYRIRVADLAALPRPDLELKFAALAAIMGGDRTLGQISETVGAEVTAWDMYRLLLSDLCGQKFVDGGTHYVPVVYKRRGARRGGSR